MLCIMLTHDNHQILSMLCKYVTLFTFTICMSICMNYVYISIVI